MVRKKRLTPRKIEYIVRHKRKSKSTRDLSEELDLCPSTIRRVWTHWNKTGTLLSLKGPGRPMKAITKDEEDLVLKAYGIYKLGARRLERVIKTVYKRQIPHNKIHRILLAHSKARRNPNKQARRKPWVRFERKHSLSMVQIDWHDSKVIEGKKVCVVLDDASRNILAGGEFDNATAEISIALIRDCLIKYGPIRTVREVLSDHGPQFFANKNAENIETKSSFDEFLQDEGIKHILAKVKHPQTCGKIERWFETYEKHRADFNNFEEFRIWYNTVRFHESLDTKWGISTPEEAFWRKLPPECLLGLFLRMNKEVGSSEE